MKLLNYLSDRKIPISIYIIVTLVTGSIIYMNETVDFLHSNGLYSVVLSFLFFGIYMSIDFYNKRTHFKKLIKIKDSSGIDWVNSLPPPMNEEQRIYSELLKKLYSDANLKLEEYRVKNIEDIEFITMWVHEIKTPIAASKLIIENSINHPTERNLYNLEDEIDKIENFVQMALYYNRVDDFSKDYIISSVSMDKVVKECIKREYSNIINKKLKLNMENLDKEIDTDGKCIEFIVKQVLDNAIKYSRQGGNIKIYIESREKETILNVEDEGIGIKHEDIKRVFDKNFTGFNGRKLYNSTGIGLYLSQKLAKKLGHHITIHSEFNHGTKVSIHFYKWNDYHDI